MCFKARPDEVGSLFIVNTVFAILGFVVCCVTIVMIVLKRSYRTQPFRLIMYLSAVCLLWSIIGGLQILPVDTGNADGPNPTIKRGWAAACEALGFFWNYLALCRVFLTLIICASAFSSKFCKMEIRTYRWELFALASSLVLPLALFTWIPFIKMSYGLGGTWCSIKYNCNVTSSLATELGIGGAIAPNVVLFFASAALVASVVASSCLNARCRQSRTSVSQKVTDFVLLLYPSLLCAVYSCTIYITVKTTVKSTEAMVVVAFCHFSNVLLPLIVHFYHKNIQTPLARGIEHVSPEETSQVKESTDGDCGTDRSLLIKK